MEIAMKHQRPEDLNSSADIVVLADTITVLNRRQKLARWAAALDIHGGPLDAPRGIEYLPDSLRLAYRSDNGPLSIAFNDPMLRAAGLTGDTLGEVMDFFEITADDAHRLLCDCHYLGSMTGRSLASRLRRYAVRGNRGFLSRLGHLLAGHRT
jgi:hypothetical protein